MPYAVAARNPSWRWCALGGVTLAITLALVPLVFSDSLPRRRPAALTWTKSASSWEAGIIDVVPGISTFGSDFFKIYQQPRQFAADLRTPGTMHTSPEAALGWTLASLALASALYKLAFKTSWARKASSALGVAVPRAPERKTKATLRIERIRFLPKRESRILDSSGHPVGTRSQWTIGLGVTLPELGVNAPEEPQAVVIDIGAVTIIVRNAIPARLATKFLKTVTLLFLAFLTAVYVFPFAELLGGTSTFASALQAAVLFFAYSLLLFGLLGLCVILVFVNAFKLGVKQLLSVWISLWVVVFVLEAWVFVQVFAETYGLSVGRLVLAVFGGMLGGALASFLFVPLLVVPLLYLLLRFQDFWEVLF